MEEDTKQEKELNEDDVEKKEEKDDDIAPVKRPPSRRDIFDTAKSDSDSEEEEDEMLECYHPCEKYYLQWHPPGSAFKVAVPLNDRSLQASGGT